MECSRPRRGPAAQRLLAAPRHAAVQRLSRGGVPTVGGWAQAAGQVAFAQVGRRHPEWPGVPAGRHRRRPDRPVSRLGATGRTLPEEPPTGLPAAECSFWRAHGRRPHCPRR